MRDLKATDCVCEEPGWCERHRCHKSDQWWRLCRQNQSFFELWEHTEPVAADSQPPDRVAIPCEHKGAFVRLQSCPTCKSPVDIKVFHCAIHRECSIATAMDAVATCRTCADYAPVDVSARTSTSIS